MGLQGPALIARRHSRQSRIPRANYIDASIRPSLSSFCSAKHNLWLQDKNIQKARRLNNYKGRRVKVFLLSLVVAFWTVNFILTLDTTCLKGELLTVEKSLCVISELRGMSVCVCVCVCVNDVCVSS